MTLFDEYPEVPPTRKPRKHYDCCADWDEFVKVVEYDLRREPWLVLHKLAHSRVPFTDEWFAVAAKVTMPVAQAMTMTAGDRKWIGMAVTEAPLRDEQGEMWVGLLTAARR